MRNLWKAVRQMVKIYVNLVKNGRRKLENIPDKYRDAVAKILGEAV